MKHSSKSEKEGKEKLIEREEEDVKGIRVIPGRCEGWSGGRSYAQNPDAAKTFSLSVSC